MQRDRQAVARGEAHEVAFGHALGVDLRPRLAHQVELAGLAVIQPVDQTQGEQVAGTVLFLHRQTQSRDGVPVQAGHRHLVHVVLLNQVSVIQRIGFVTRLLEIPLVEFVQVDNQRSAPLQIREVRLQRGGVHRHERVDLVTRGEDVLARTIQLKTADARQSPLRGANLSGKVGQGAHIVAEGG